MKKTEIYGLVRNDKMYHELTQFVTPYDNTIMMLCDVFSISSDPIAACQDYVVYRVQYTKEKGEYWQYPMETLMKRIGDCDCCAVLLCTLLRNFASEDEVFVVVGDMKKEGHAWLVYKGKLLEPTRGSTFTPNISDYKAELMFNDKKIYLAMPNSFGYYFVER